MEEINDCNQNDSTDIFDIETQEQEPVITEVHSDDELEPLPMVEDTVSDVSDDSVVECSQEYRLNQSNVQPEAIPETSEDENEETVEQDLWAISEEADTMLLEEKRKLREAETSQADLPKIFEGPQELQRRDEQTIDENTEQILESEDENPNDLDYKISEDEEEEETETEDEEVEDEEMEEEVKQIDQ